jgi:hypothetical protein
MINGAHSIIYSKDPEADRVEALLRVFATIGGRADAADDPALK